MYRGVACILNIYRGAACILYRGVDCIQYYLGVLPVQCICSVQECCMYTIYFIRVLHVYIKLTQNREQRAEFYLIK